MKKTVLAAALAAASCLAQAQSSVTIFGIVDAVVTVGRGSISNRTGLDNSGKESSRLGFRGTEDLGGGLYAGFHLEGALNNDNGTGAATNVNNQSNGGALAGLAGGQGFTFGRKMHVQIGGNWGEVRLGRDYTPVYPNQSQFDPMGTNGVGTSQVRSNLGGPTNVRASNSIGYFLPRNIGGFYGQAMYFMGENSSNAANSDDGTGMGIRLGYGAGPFTVAIATQRTEFLTGDIRTSNIGGSYNAGFATFRAMYQVDDIKGGARGKGAVMGANVPLGSHELRGSYGFYERDTAGNPKARKLSLGYVHNLSKRTALYTTVARLRNSGGSSMALNGSSTAPNSSSTGFDFGITQLF
ncbi:MAG: porin [Pseudomonadota bacterium]